MGQKQTTHDSSIPYGHLEKLRENIWGCHQDTSGKTDYLVTVNILKF